MENNLIPTYEFVLSKEDDKLLGISLVDSPAIQSEYLMFNSNEIQLFAIQSEEQQLITGAVMIPGMRIARISEQLGQFYGYFSKQTIRELVYKYEMSDTGNNFNFQHNGQSVNGIYTVESWFVDGANDKSKSLGLNLPEGTYMMTVYVPDKELWTKIKQEGLKGFSIEAKLDLIPANFRKQNFCPVSYKDVIKAKIKKSFYESNLEFNTELVNKGEVQLEKWSSNCQCSNCKELTNLSWNLPGVLPEGDREFKTISKD